MIFRLDFLNACHSSQRGHCCLFGEDEPSLESVGTIFGGLQESAPKLHWIRTEIFKALAAQRHSMGELRKMQNAKKNKNWTNQKFCIRNASKIKKWLNKINIKKK